MPPSSISTTEPLSTAGIVPTSESACNVSSKDGEPYDIMISISFNKSTFSALISIAKLVVLLASSVTLAATVRPKSNK